MRRNQVCKGSWLNQTSRFFAKGSPDELDTNSGSEEVWSDSWGDQISRPDQIRYDQSLSSVRLFATPWIVARRAFLSLTNSRSSLRLMSIESAMPSSHLILCCPLLLLPPIPPSIAYYSPKLPLNLAPTHWQSQTLKAKSGKCCSKMMQSGDTESYLFHLHFFSSELIVCWHKAELFVVLEIQ